jgi:hypothetical protein
MAKLTHEDIHIPFQSKSATQLQPRVLVVARMFLVVALFNLEVSFFGSYQKERPHCIVVVDAHVGSAMCPWRLLHGCTTGLSCI